MPDRHFFSPPTLCYLSVPSYPRDPFLIAFISARIPSFFGFDEALTFFGDTLPSFLRANYSPMSSRLHKVNDLAFFSLVRELRFFSPPDAWKISYFVMLEEAFGTSGPFFFFFFLFFLSRFPAFPLWICGPLTFFDSVLRSF